MSNPDGMPVTPEEDEEWERMEANKHSIPTLYSVRSKAVTAAYEFTESYKNELHIMTLRKAYEMGYVCGSLDRLLADADGESNAK